MSRNYKKRTVCKSRLGLFVLFNSFVERIAFYPLNLFLILLIFINYFSILIVLLIFLFVKLDKICQIFATILLFALFSWPNHSNSIFLVELELKSCALPYVQS